MPFALDDGMREAIQQQFRRAPFRWDEDFFLGVLSTSAKRYDIYWAVIGLRECGSATSVPALKAIIRFPMQDVRCCAVLTIAQIAKAEETPYYIQCLQSPEYREKAYAMWAIEDTADERAVDAVIHYFEKQRARIKKGTLTNGTLALGLRYLQKVGAAEERWAWVLDAVEAAWLQNTVQDRLKIASTFPRFSKLI